MSALLKTPLYHAHVEVGARMAEFAGWDMPVQYAGLMEEHHAVRNSVAVFDVSHMGEIAVTGKDAVPFLQNVVTTNVGRLRQGRSQYTLICNERGGVIEDAILYHHDGYLLVVNAGNKQAVWEWLSGVAARFEVDLLDRSDEYALLAVQGPEAERSLQPLCDLDLQRLRRSRVRPAVLAGRGVLVARTGYTGEDGFEIFMAAYDAPRIWDGLMDANIPPAGLGARNTLRLEAGMALHGNELSPEINPFEASLERFVDMEKGEFVGRESLVDVAADGPDRLLYGFRMRGRAIPRDGYGIKAASGQGMVTSGSYSPTLQVGIAMGFLPGSLRRGDDVMIEIRGRDHEAEIVDLPFYRRENERRPGAR